MLRPQRVFTSKKRNGSVALVELDVEVGHAAVPDALHESLCALNNGVLSFAKNAQRVADSRRVVVLQAYDAARHAANLAFRIREGRQRANRIIATRDEVLEHHEVVVARFAQGFPNLGHLGSIFDFVNLAPSTHRRLGVLELCRIRRLRNERKRKLVKRKLVGAGIAAVEVPSLGVRDVEFLAQFVEAALLRDVVEQVEIDVGDDDACGLKARFRLGEHACMAIVTAEHHRDDVGVLVSEFGGDALERRIEHFRVVHVGDEAVIGEAACREHLDVGGGKHDGLFDAECPVEPRARSCKRGCRLPRRWA